MAVTSRAVFLPKEARSRDASADVLVLDLERHTSLVTPMGASLDGALGLRAPRRQDLWALYSVTGGRIDGVWLTPAQQPAAGADSSSGGSLLAGEAAFDALRARGREWSAFSALIERRLGSDYVSMTGPLHTARVGSYEMQGRRPTMEDQMAIERLRAPHIARPAMASVQFLGLYDGHGGAGCAEFSAQRLHTCLAASPAFGSGDVGAALTEAFAECERAFLRETESPSGSCAVVAVIGGGKLYLAHIGDSRVVLCSGEKAEAVPLTVDHKPDSVSEKARIDGVGGMVVIGGRCARVTHPGTSMMLATSRSFGDRGFKDSWESIALAMQLAVTEGEGGAEEGETTEAVPPPDGVAAASSGGGGLVVTTPAGRDEGSESGAGAGSAPALQATLVQPLLSPVPSIAERVLAPADRFVILACDGVWDVLTDQQACDSVRAALDQPHATPEEAARKLVGDAYNAGSEDNISVLVAVLGQELV